MKPHDPQKNHYLGETVIASRARKQERRDRLDDLPTAYDLMNPESLDRAAEQGDNLALDEQQRRHDHGWADSER